MFKKFALSTAVAASALTAMPAAAEAQSRYGYYGRDHGYEQQLSRRRPALRSALRRAALQPALRNQRYGNHYGRRCSGSSTGTIIGAIAGGLLGREVAGRGDRTIGAIIGGAAGALAGREIDRNGNLPPLKLQQLPSGSVCEGGAGHPQRTAGPISSVACRTSRASCSIIVPPSCSASMIVTARLIIAGDVVADADRDQLDRRARLDPADHLAQMPLEIGAAELTDRVESSTGAPSEITIRILRSSTRPISRLCAQSSASPSIFSLSSPSRIIRPRLLARPPPGLVGLLVDDVPQVVEPARAAAAARRPAISRAPGRPSRRGW